ncbi:hypothetical protein K2X83_00660 [Patescibacteria group bacterium]|nr:hypothetical protein [Patescibacteria group bacterium]
MPDGNDRAEKVRAFRPPRLKTETSREDKQQLQKIRLMGKNGPLQSLINAAFFISDNNARDAALGNILKHRIHYILQTPALFRELPYQQDDLRFFVPMISNQEKREQMLRRIDAMASRKD